jgi:predicted AAA+ superfamily ATPase
VKAEVMSQNSCRIRSPAAAPGAIVPSPIRRQSGQATLVRELFAGKPCLPMEDRDIRLPALEDPRGLLARYPAGAMIDEAQHASGLFPYLQTRVDETSAPGQFVPTGSQNFLLIRGIGQSLAGRAAMAQLPPLIFATTTRTIRC